VKRLNNQTGSAHVIVIIVLVLTVLGLLGFVFWQNFIQKKDTAATTNVSTTTKTTTTTATTVDAYSGWGTYTNSTYGFTLRYPSDWTLGGTNSQNLATLASPDIATETNGSIDAVRYDIGISAQKKTGTSSGSTLSSVYALQQEQAGKDTSGVVIKKYTETINSIAVTEYDMNAQQPYFAVLFSTGDSYIEINFCYAPTKADLTATTSKILASLKAS